MSAARLAAFGLVFATVPLIASIGSVFAGRTTVIWQPFVVVLALGLLPLGMLVSPLWLLAVAILALPFDALKFGPLDLVSAPNVAFAVLTVRVGIGLAVQRWPVPPRFGLTLLIAALFLLGFVPSVVIADDPGAAARIFVSLAAMAMIFVLTPVVCRDKRSLQIVMRAFFVAAIVASVAALAEALLYQAGLNLWDAPEVELLNLGTVVLRIQGFSGSTSYLALYLLPVIACAVTARWSQARGDRILAVVAGALSLITMLLTFTRGAILALAAIVVLAGMRALWRRFGRASLLPQAFVLSLTALAFSPVFDFLTGFNETSFQTRLSLAFGGVATFLANPLFGQGLGTSVIPVWSATVVSLAPGVTLSEDVTTVLEARGTHNILLQLGSNSGVFGLAGYLLLLGVVLYVALRARPSGDPWVDSVRAALVFGIIAMQLTSMTLDSLVVKQIYVAMTLLWATSLIGSPEPVSPPQPSGASVRDLTRVWHPQLTR